MSEEQSEVPEIEPVRQELASVEEESSESEDEDDIVPSDRPAIAGEDREAVIETLLFASGDPMDIKALSEISGIPRDEVKTLLQSLQDRLIAMRSGFEVIEVASKYQLRTRAKFGAFVRILRSEKPRRLSSPALETLAIIAYRQPVVKSDIEKIRGVDTTPTLKTLLERGLIQITGHQSTAGNPALYGTTEEFLKIFGLRDLSALPTIRDLNMLEQDPGETDEEDRETNQPTSAEKALLTEQISVETIHVGSNPPESIERSNDSRRHPNQDMAQ